MADESRTTVPMVRIGLLGPVRAAVGGQSVDLGGGRQRALLAALAVDVGRTVSTGALIDAVWDGDPPDAADRTFRTYVARLRRAFDRVGADGAAVVVTAAAGYRLDAAIVTTDVQAFEGEVAGARARLSAGEAAAASEQLSAALDRWEGRALGEFADRPWAAPSSTRLEEARRAARELLVRALLDAGRIDAAVTLVEQLAAAQPLRDSVARLRALALYRTGRDADALQGLREFRERLVEEHGLDPSPRLVELESMILERDPRLDRAVGGRRLRGYVLHEPIARSPLGTVHRAEQPSIGREVAVTVLAADVADDADVVRAFETRVQAVAALDHAHLLPVYDYWREPGGAYVVTRFPSGGTLAQQLRTGGLDASRTLQLGQQVAAALAAAHDVGVVHGRLDADAIVVDDRGDAFVWAFPVTAEAHPRDDVAALATLVTTAMAGGEAGGGVATAVLPEPAATAVRDALDSSGGSTVTAASLAAAFDAALRGDQGVPPVPVEAGPNPYRGLAAFREVDSDVFFGRDALVEQVRARLARLRAVAVVGPSGAGKSSAVRAGVLPALRTGGDFVTTMLPGTRPLAELEVALSRVAARDLDGVADEVASAPEGLRHVVDRVLPAPDGDLVLVVDQFEELFTLSTAAERDLFLAALRAVVEDPNARAKVLVTLRADFLGQVLSHPVAGPLVRDRAVMVGPLTDDELHEAVTRPAEVAGVAVEPALATAVVADAARFPGSLPMVQFALTEVFEAAADGTMTLAAYRRIGGIEGVLGQRAEEVFQQLGEGEQRAASTMFQRLVVPHDDGPPARRRALRAEFGHVPDEVIDAFGRARLLRFDHDEESREPTVEVTHEALFRAWPRLVAWIEEGEDDLRLLGHLTVSASDWDAGGRREADLYRGHRLDAALAFAADRREELSDTERAYLDASAARRARDAEADRRSVRRLRSLTGGLAVGLALALVAGVVAVVAQRQEATTAEAAQADALAFAAAAIRGDDLELAALLAAEAYAVDPDGESQRALLDVLNHSPQVLQLLDPPPDAFCGGQPPGGEAYAIARFADDSTYVDVRDYDLTPLGEVTPVYEDPFEASCPTVDPQGRWVIAGDSLTGVLRTYDVAMNTVLGELEGWRYPGGFADVVTRPQGDEAIVMTPDDRLLRVSLPDLEVLAEIAAPTGVPGLLSGTYSEDGSLITLLTGEQGVEASRGVLVVDLDGSTVASLPETPGVFEAVTAAQAGIVVMTRQDGVAQVAPLDAPSSVTALGLRGGASGTLAVHPDGDLVAFATTEGLEVVGLGSLRPVGLPIGVSSSFGAPVWGPGGELLFAGPANVATIDIDRSLGVGETVSDVGPLGFATQSAPDGSGVAHVGDPDAVWVDSDTGERIDIGPWSPDFQPTAVLVDDGVAVMDFDRRVFERRVRGELVVESPFPDSVPAGLRRIFGILRVDNGVAVHVAQELGDTPGSPVVAHHLVAFDVESGEALSHQVFPQGDGPETIQARALDRDRVFVAFRDGHGEVRSMGGQVLASREQIVGNGEFIGVAAGGNLVAGTDIADAITVLDDELQPVARLTGFSDATVYLGFVSEDVLVSRHFDGSTFLWDLRTSQLLGRLFKSDGAEPYSVNVADDGPAVFHTTPSGLVRIDIDPDAWAEKVCELVSRPLEQVELDAIAPGREVLDPCGDADAA